MPLGNGSSLAPSAGTAIAPFSRSRTGAFRPALIVAVLLLVPLFALRAQAQTVEYGAASYTATEGGTAATVTVTMSTAPPAQATIPLTTTNGDGTMNADFAGVPANLTFDTTDTSKAFTVTVTSDTMDEADKSVVLGFGTLLPAGVTVGTQTTATVNLIDDDPEPTLSVNDATASEGNGAVFTVTLSAASEKTVTVRYATSIAGTDTAGSTDFTAVTSTAMLTFSAGDTSETFTVSTTEDSIDEDSETFTVTLSSPSNATLDDATGRGTINDDDSEPTLSVNDATASEGNGAVFTATLSAASAKTVTVRYATSIASGDTAESVDFTAVSATTLTFSAGDTSETFTVSTTEDSTDEDSETFTVTLSSPSNATLDDATGRGTINDDDSEPTLSINNATASEGDGAVFTVTLSAASQKVVTARYATSIASSDTAESADFTAVSATTLTFSAGDTSRTLTVSTKEDTIDEDNETFTVTLSSPSNATLDDATGQGTINDDDSAPTLSLNDATASEGNGAVFTATLSAQSQKVVTVRYATSISGSDTAESTDFTAVSATTLTFSAGDTSEMFTVSTTEDTTDEDDETFTVTLSSPSNATTTDATGKGTINDDDNPPTVTVADATGSEGDRAVFTVTLSAESQKVVTVSYVASISGSDTAESTDFTAVSATTLTFSAEDTSETFTVSTTEDTTDEDDETFTVTLSSPSNTTITDGTAKGTILDDDDPPTVSVGDASAEEGGGVTFTATLSARSEKTVGVSYTASVESGDTAKSSDLTGTLTGMLTYNPDDESKTFSVGTREDTIDERNETFTVTLSSPSNTTIGDGTGTGTIDDDDDTPTVTLSLSTSSTREDNSTAVTVTASLNRPSTEATTVTVSADAMSPAVPGDFNLSANRRLVIAAEQTTSAGTVTATPVDNDTDAPDKDVIVSATAANDFAVTAPGSLTLAITDDDPAPVVRLALTQPSISEDGGETPVTASLDRPSSEPTTVTVTAEAVSPAVATDFTVTGSTLTIPAGATNSSGSVRIGAEDNNVDAPDKAVTVKATAQNQHGIAGDPGDVTLAITDEDPAPKVTLVLAQASIRESDDLDMDGDQHVTTVRATQERPSSEVTTVTVAPSSSDFTLSASGILTIPAGDTESTAAVTLTAVDDNVDAPDKALTLNATAVNTQGVVQPDGVALAIVDEEPPPTATLVPSDLSFDEKGGQVTVAAELSHPSSEATSVRLAATALSPAMAADFKLTASVLLMPAGTTRSTGEATLTAVDNGTDAPDKELRVSAIAENAQGLAGNPADVTLTIPDDEPAPTVTLSLSRNPIPEAGGEALVTAALSHPSSEVTRLTVSAEAVGPAVAADFSLFGTALSIPKGLTDSTGTVRLEANNNDVDALDKQVTVAAAAANIHGIAGDPPDVTMTIADDDERGFAWLPEALTVPDTQLTPFTVALTSEPTQPVTVTLTGTRDARLIVGTEGVDFQVVQTLTFTPANWSVPQTLTLFSGTTVVGEATRSIRHSAAGGDYAGLSRNYPVTLVGSGGAPRVILTVDRVSIAEDAGLTSLLVTATRGGVSTAGPRVVTVTVEPGTASADDFTATPRSFTMTIRRGASAADRSIALQPTNDGIDEDEETLTFTGTAANLTVTPAELTIRDDDTRGITVSQARLSVDENGNRNYTVVLNSAPDGEVTVAPTVTGDPDVTVNPAALTFTAVTWDTPQAVTVSAADDEDPADDRAMVSHTVSGADYGANNVTAAPVLVTVDDDDGRGVRVSTRDLLVQEGDSATYTVVLNSEPTGSVVLRPTVAGDPDVTASPAALTFAAATWDTAQTVTVEAAEDADPADDRAAVSHAVSGADYGTNNVSAPEVLVRVRDAGVMRTAATLTVSTSRYGEDIFQAGVRVTATLDGPVRARDTVVTVLVRGGTASVTDFAAEPAAFTLTIRAGQGSGTATFDFTAEQDAIDEDDETVIVSGTAADLELADVELTIEDDDTRGLRVSRSSLTVDEDSSATYQVALNSQPTGTVTVMPLVSGAREVTVRPEMLAFTAGNWKDQQTVTVNAARDPDAEDGQGEVAHSASGADYDGVTGPTLTVTVRDDGVESEELRLEVEPAEVAEEGGTETVTVTAILDAAPRSTDTLVTVQVHGGTATEETDFAAVNDITLTIRANETEARDTFPFSPVNDITDEGDGETVMVTGVADAADLLVRRTELTITDDDAPSTAVTLTISPERVAEDASEAAQTVTVTAELDAGARPEDTEVRVSVSGVTAIQGTDFAAVGDFTLTIPASTTSGEQGFTLSPVDDDMDEPDETVRVSGSASGLRVEPAPGLEVTIADDDATPVATLLVTPESIRENGETSRVTATLDHASSEPTTVTVSVVPVPGAEDRDFTQSGTTLAIPAGSTRSSGSVTVRAVDNDVQANVKLLVVSGRATNELGVRGPSVRTLRITDDESPSSRVVLTVSPDVVEEGRSRRVTVTATLDGAPRRQATEVALSVSGRTALREVDFPAVPDFTLTIAADRMSGTGSFDLAPVDDQVDESDETVSVIGRVSGLVVTSATVTITDRLALPPPRPLPPPPPPSATGVTLVVEPGQVAEGATDLARTVTVEAVLDDGAGTEATEVTVTVAGGTATEGDDFAAVPEFTVTIAAGESSGTESFTLAPVDDAVDEPDETVVVTGTASGAVVSPAAGLMVTITDDDERGVTVTPVELAVAKGGSRTYELALTSQPTAAVTIEVSTDSPAVLGGPDLLTFEPDRWNVAQVVTVGVADDDSVEEGAVVELTHTVTGGDYGDNGVAADPVTVTVTASSVTLTLSPERVTEDATGNLTVTATLEGEPQAEATEVTVTVAGGTATEGDDFAAVLDFTITIPAGGTTGTESFTLAPVDDAVDEPDETVVVTGTVSGAVVSPAAGLMVTIADDDERGVTAAPAEVALLEGGSGSYRVELTSQPTATVTIEVSSGNPAVTAAPALLTFEPDGWNTAQTVTVRAAEGDAVADGAAVELAHTVSGGDYGENGVTLGSVTATVRRLRAALSVSPEQVAEGATDIARTVAVTVTLDGGPRAEATEVAVTVSGGTATEAEDFAAVPEFTVTITAGEASGTESFTLAPVDDAVDEGDETVVVTGTASGAVVSPVGGVMVTITDDDERGVTVSPKTVTVLRGGSESYEVKLTSQPAATVTIEVSAGSSGVTVDPALLTFEPEEWNVAQVVTVMVADDDSVADETAVELTHTVMGGDYGENGVAAGPVTVTVTSLRAAMTVSPGQVAEGVTDAARNMAVEVTLDGPRAEATEVAVTVSGGTATEGEDFAAVPEFTVTITAGEASGTESFTLAPVDDAVDEPDETVVVIATAPGLASPRAMVTITDDDERGVTVSPKTVTVLRGGSESYEVELTSQPAATVTIEVSAGSSGVMVDPALLTFEPEEWNVAQVVTVMVTDDDSVADETAVELTHTVMGGDYGENGVAAGPVTVTVTSLRAAMTVSPGQVAEGVTDAARNIAVEVTLDGPRAEDTEVTVTVSGGTATEGDDFGAVSDFTITIPAGGTTGTGSFTLAPVDDAADEPDETVVVIATAPGLASPKAMVTITDDDERGVTVSPKTVTVLKGGSESYEVELTSQPAATVTIEVSAGSSGVTVDPALLTFEPEEWNVAQVVTVMVADDDSVADETAVELTHTVMGGDYGENGVAAGPVTVTVTSLRAAMTVSPGQVAEGVTDAARNIAVEVTLDGPRAEDTEVTVTVSGGTATEGDDFGAVSDFTITIPAGGTTGTGSFTLAPVDDAVDEPDETVVVIATAPGLASPKAMVTITDDDERGVMIAPMALTVLEGGSGTYEVVLASRPTSSVTVAVDTDDPDVTATPSALTFAGSSWNTAQTVTVKAVDDDLVEEDAAARIKHVLSGGDYGLVAAEPVAVTVPGFEVDDMTVTFRIAATGEVVVPDGTPVPHGMRLVLPPALAGETVALTAVGESPALANPPRGYHAGNPLVDIELRGGMALGAGQTGTVCLPAEGGGSARVYRYDESSDPPEWVQLPEPAGGSPDGLACGVTDRFSLFALGSTPKEAVANAWLPRFGRTVAQHVVDAVQERIRAPRTTGLTGSLAGQGVAAGDEAPEAVAARRGSGDELRALRLRIDPGLAGSDDDLFPGHRNLTVRDLVTGTNFTLTNPVTGGGSISLWGRGAWSGFGGREGGAEIDGDVTTAALGADWASGRLMAGLALSHSRGDGAWQEDGGKDDVESSLTGVHPYLSYQVAERLSVWAVAGHGRGRLKMADGAGRASTGIDMTMTAAGARGDLTPGGSAAGLGLALEVDGLYLRIGADATQRLEAVQADVSRFRLGLEGSWTMAMEDGQTLTPSFEVGLRHDGGDAETGVGVDIGGGLAYSNPGQGLTASLNARRLVAHQAEAFEDWGLSGALLLDLDASSGRGLSVSLRQSVGYASSDGVEALFRRDVLADLADGNADTGSRMEAEAAYGFEILGGRLLGTPYVRFGLAGNGRDYTLGWRLGPAGSGGSAPALRIAASRHERAGGRDPEHRVGVQVELSW